MIYSLVFSPTGGTQRVTRYLASAFGNVGEYELCVPEDEIVYPVFSSQDLVFISVPSFRGRVPSLARERILKCCGNGAKAVITAVYGNREYEDTLIELSDTVENARFRVIAATAAIAEHSELRSLANGRPDKEDRIKLNSFSQMIKDKLGRNDFSKPAIPGNRPYKEDNGRNTPPLPDDTCTKCMKCARSCPAMAIDRESPYIKQTAQDVSHVCTVSSSARRSQEKFRRRQQCSCPHFSADAFCGVESLNSSYKCGFSEF